MEPFIAVCLQFHCDEQVNNIWLNNEADNVAIRWIDMPWQRFGIYRSASKQPINFNWKPLAADSASWLSKYSHTQFCCSGCSREINFISFYSHQSKFQRKKYCAAWRKATKKPGSFLLARLGSQIIFQLYLLLLKKHVSCRGNFYFSSILNFLSTDCGIMSELSYSFYII